MRTTLSIPDEYYLKIKPLCLEEGYQTINELLLDLIRHHFDDIPVIKATYQKKVKNPGFDIKGKDPIKEFVKKQPNICGHGAMKGLCKHGCK